MNLQDKKDLLLEVAKAWYLGQETENEMSDMQFDALESEIVAEDPTWNYRDNLELQGETKNHYAPMTKVNKFQEHERGMDEVFKDLRTKKDLADTPKLDGGGLILYYKEGILYDALTRSSQTDGKRQFEKVKTMVPRVLMNKEITAIECEVVVDLKHGFGDLSRQKATGLLNSNSLQADCEKYLTIAAFKTRYENEKPLAEWSKDLSELPVLVNGSNLTFHPIPVSSGTYKNNKFEGIAHGFKVNYLIDGIVVHFDPFSLLHDEYLAKKQIKEGRDSVAHKLYFNEKKISVITDIEWNLNPIALKYVPKYKYTPVNVDGTNCGAATAGGTAQLLKMKCGIGTEVEIIKAGLTIPQVLRPTAHFMGFESHLKFTGLTTSTHMLIFNFIEDIKNLIKDEVAVYNSVTRPILNDLVTSFEYSTDGYTFRQIDAKVKELVKNFVTEGVSVEWVQDIEPIFNASEDYGLPFTCACGTELTIADDLNGGLYCSNPVCSVNRELLQADLDAKGMTMKQMIVTNPIEFVTGMLKCPRFGGLGKIKNNTSRLIKSEMNSKGKLINTYEKYTLIEYKTDLFRLDKSPLEVTKKYFDLSGMQIAVMEKFDTLVYTMLKESI